MSKITGSHYARAIAWLALATCAALFIAIALGLNGCGGAPFSVASSEQDAGGGLELVEALAQPDAGDEAAAPDVRKPNGETGSEPAELDAAAFGPDVVDAKTEREAAVEAAPPAAVCIAGEAQCAGRAVVHCVDGQWGPPAPCAQPVPDCRGGSCECLETYHSDTGFCGP